MTSSDTNTTTTQMANRDQAKGGASSENWAPSSDLGMLLAAHGAGRAASSASALPSFAQSAGVDVKPSQAALLSATAGAMGVSQGGGGLTASEQFLNRLAEASALMPGAASFASGVGGADWDHLSALQGLKGGSDWAAGAARGVLSNERHHSGLGLMSSQTGGGLAALDPAMLDPTNEIAAQLLAAEASAQGVGRFSAGAFGDMAKGVRRSTLPSRVPQGLPGLLLEGMSSGQLQDLKGQLMGATSWPAASLEQSLQGLTAAQLRMLTSGLAGSSGGISDLGGNVLGAEAIAAGGAGPSLSDLGLLGPAASGNRGVPATAAAASMKLARSLKAVSESLGNTGSFPKDYVPQSGSVLSKKLPGGGTEGLGMPGFPWSKPQLPSHCNVGAWDSLGAGPAGSEAAMVDLAGAHVPRPRGASLASVKEDMKQTSGGTAVSPQQMTASGGSQREGGARSGMEASLCPSTRSTPQTEQEKRARKLALNREAARRMRRRQAMRLEELERMVLELQTSNMATKTKLKEATRKVGEMEERSSRLEEKVVDIVEEIIKQKGDAQPGLQEKVTVLVGCLSAHKKSTLPEALRTFVKDATPLTSEHDAALKTEGFSVGEKRKMSPGLEEADREASAKETRVSSDGNDVNGSSDEQGTEEQGNKLDHCPLIMLDGGIEGNMDLDAYMEDPSHGESDGSA